jgi:hypothetical protein
MTISNKALLVASLFISSSLAGCFAPSENAADADLGDEADQTAEVAQRIATASDIAHACTHAQSPSGGSYISVSPTAAASGSSPVALEHDAYDFTLPGSTTKSGWVKFSPDETAEHGIYTDPSTVSICVKLSNAGGTGTTGSCLSQVYTTTISDTTCASSGTLPTFGTTAAISRVRTYNLTLGQDYFVQFTKTGDAHHFAMFENLDEVP